jgi:DNA modification methylase
VQKDRLVVETEAGRKEALQRVLRERGVTVADWFEEQLDLLLIEHQPSYGFDTGKASASGAGVDGLDRVDWAFVDADTTYLSHDVHPYPAKFIPQIPSTAIAHLSHQGDVVLDPFGGSGTTALEAVRLGRRAISLDANPLAELMGRVKTARLDRNAKSELKALRVLIVGHLDNLPDSHTAFSEEYAAFVPEIPNIDKWFSEASRGELALLRAAASRLPDGPRDIAQLALSRIVGSASFQDSETRYASRPREIAVGAVLTMYIAALDAVVRRVEATSSLVRYGVAKFITEDARNLQTDVLEDCSIDLVVTSPPYGNATDYHLYHRFRLFWLGHDPKTLGRVEIGSHLRHQRDGTGFVDYLGELTPCLEGLHRVLRPGSHAVLVLGDSVYEGSTYDTAREVAHVAQRCGFDVVKTIERPIHQSRRSFIAAARRATTEKLIVLQRPIKRDVVSLIAPSYRMWAFEKKLRRREIATVLGEDTNDDVQASPFVGRAAKRLTFTRGLQYPGGFVEPTWQQILENGYEDDGRRKDPKYVTHGIHSYKGKFYPQLAKSLLNIVGLEAGMAVLDPFCGSGTTLLEARLNGFRAYGCDLNPLAAKIARAKVGIIDADPDLVLEAVEAIESRIAMTKDAHQGDELDQIPQSIREEAASWFAYPVIYKINAVLRAIRTSTTGILREYFEVILSSLIRDVSQQEPRDLRIRRRRIPLTDADVLGLFSQRLRGQVDRLEHFWETRGYSPFQFHEAVVAYGDCRTADVYSSLGLEANSVDCIVTSPPYATALPYIDTDRLSLLLLFGLTSSARRPLEMDLTGSREITVSDRRKLETLLDSSQATFLPQTVIAFLASLLKASRNETVGFRKLNRASLLLRFFSDMASALEQCKRVGRRRADVIMVVGDSTTEVKAKRTSIPTTSFIREIAESLGLELVEEFSIDVTTENLKHSKNAITENRVLRFRNA